MKSAEQQARDMLERAGVENAQSMTAGDLVEVANLIHYLAAMTKERDEADRRAGAAERRLESAQEDAIARASWLRKAKQQWGAEETVSFDVVWNEALTLKQQLREALAAFRAKVLEEAAEFVGRNLYDAKTYAEELRRMAKEE